MDKGLLCVVFDNRPFIVDPEKQEFRHYYRKDDTIAFRALQKEGAFYSLELLGEQLRFPKEVILDPASLSDWARFGINVKSQEDGWGIFLGDERLARRLSGELPHLDILGTDFTVDVRLHQLRETAEPWKQMSLEDLDVSPDGYALRFLYDKESHQRVEHSVGDVPESVVLVEIPQEVILDPVAVSRQYDLGDTGLLLRHPLRSDLAAVGEAVGGSRFGTVNRRTYWQQQSALRNK